VPTFDDVDVTPALQWAESTVGPISHVRALSGGWTSTMLALTTLRGSDVVLRLMTREPWRSHGPALTTRERHIQRLLAESPVAAPTSLALDAEGRQCGFSAHLMTLLPGRVDPDRVDGRSLGQLAQLLCEIHRVPPHAGIRPYESWAWEAKYVVPGVRLARRLRVAAW
jgi:aminoglycoside phosphotransferase (APT) family kinase protein